MSVNGTNDQPDAALDTVELAALAALVNIAEDTNAPPKARVAAAGAALQHVWAVRHNCGGE